MHLCMQTNIHKLKTWVKLNLINASTCIQCKYISSKGISTRKDNDCLTVKLTYLRWSREIILIATDLKRRSTCTHRTYWNLNCLHSLRGKHFVYISKTILQIQLKLNTNSKLDDLNEKMICARNICVHSVSWHYIT